MAHLSHGAAVICVFRQDPSPVPKLIANELAEAVDLVIVDLGNAFSSI